MKIITFYLSQFHQTPENNMWWGEGYTEWDLVKNAKPLFKGHNQPTKPLYEYDLTDIEALKWQAELAKKYGVYGFCIYHYWFEGKKLLHKPLEILLENKDIDIPFCLCWANETWTDVWRNPNPKILLEQTYGDKNDWYNHYQYLKRFLQDKRYITINNKPLIVIYRPSNIPNLKEMLEYWNSLSINDGIGEIAFAYYHCEYYFDKKRDDELFQYQIEMQPTTSKELYDSKIFKEKINFLKFLDSKHIFEKLKIKRPLIIRDYDKAWKNILNTPRLNENCIPGSFVNWDNSPRYKRRGDLYIGYTPKKFENYFYKQLVRAKKEFNSDYIFLFAWNEWSEGGYLEPDTRDGYKRLEAVKNALDNFNQHPVNNNPE